MVEAAANRAAGLLVREAVTTAITRVRRNPEIEALELPKATAESNAGMAHTERYSTRHNLGMETGGPGHGPRTWPPIPAMGWPVEAIETKVGDPACGRLSPELGTDICDPTHTRRVVRGWQ